MAIDLRTVLSPVIVGDACSPAVTFQVSFTWGQRLGLLLRVDMFLRERYSADYFELFTRTQIKTYCIRVLQTLSRKYSNHLMVSQLQSCDWVMFLKKREPFFLKAFLFTLHLNSAQRTLVPAAYWSPSLHLSCLKVEAVNCPLNLRLQISFLALWLVV